MIGVRQTRGLPHHKGINRLTMWYNERSKTYGPALLLTARTCHKGVSSVGHKYTPIQLALFPPQITKKRCTKCGITKSLDKFGPDRNRADGHTTTCRECEAAQCRDYRRRHVEEERERSRQDRLKMRLMVLSHYSHGAMCCAICGESRLPVLDIDHINGDGAVFRKALGVASGTNTYWWLKQHGFPPGYRVLCRNCNWMEYLRLNELNKTSSENIGGTS